MPNTTFNTILEAFDASQKLHHDQVAVICGEQTMTYRQLHLRSNALAAQLRLMNVKSGDLVGVCSERRVELAVALLGILKAGAGYVPFDTSYPAARLREMAADAGIKVLLGNSDALEDGEFEQLHFDDFPKPKKSRTSVNIDGENIAYVMFTSGSTGKPKGVAVPHRAILRLVINQDYCNLGPNERILQHSPVAFDASTFEIWGALLNGGQLVIMPETSISLRTIGEAISTYGITTMWLTAGLFHALVDERPADLRPLSQLLTGGDVVSPTHCAKILKVCPDLKLINGYGPTENTTFTCCHPITLEQLIDTAPIPIGKPISGTQVQILDEDLNIVTDGTTGELVTFGAGLALGYWQNESLTAEKFVTLADGTKIYRTGDLATRNEDGTIHFFGRIDQQVKIRGYRIELAEIENAILEITDIEQVAVIAEATLDNSDKTLIAHYVSKVELTKDKFHEKLEKSLPKHCVPSFYHKLEAMPLTPNGKIDRKSLPSIKQVFLNQPEKALKKDNSSAQSTVYQSFCEVLNLSSIPENLNFFDLGASSLQIARIHEKIQNALGITISITDFFRYPTIQTFTDSLDPDQKAKKTDQNQNAPNHYQESIAIIGMAGRFPGAPDVDTFWENLVAGRETISHFTQDELDFENATATGADPSGVYVRSRGIVDQSDYFDAQHFSIPPREAQELDPQHRLMLECAQTVLENAGHDPDRFDGKIGIFCGSSQNSYLLNNLCNSQDFSRKLAAGYPTTNFNALLGNDKDFLPTRIAYKLNLKGPAMSVQCACSTSLVSVAQACESLRSGTCDAALAGGISLGHPQKRDYIYTPDGIASSDGHCRAFDENATGTVFGEGVGLVMLRRLSDAIADGDNIIAVIRGFALNNDGSSKAGYTAPSINGQIQVIREAQKSAGVEAESIGYIEAHGTGTPLGDPIEIAALNAAFRETTDKKHFCTIGTGKTNLGHLDIAAGITGLIKAALTVQKGVIPALLHFKNPNPNMDLANSPFVPASELKTWKPEQGPRRAGVSAFGVGGTNVHMILEEHSTQPGEVSGTTGSKSYILPLSATHPDALQAAVINLGNYAKEHPETDLNSLSYTLQQGRRNYDIRTILTARTSTELSTKAAAHSGKGITKGNYRNVIFMFPGQGAQHPEMAKDLYETEPVFRSALNQCAELIRIETDVDLIQAMFPNESEKEAMDQLLKNTALAQPAIFSVEYALVQQWKHWGINPACLVGHSIGEFAAATVAGVFTLCDVIKLICLRGKLMTQLPRGSMISVNTSVDKIAPFLSAETDLAAVNSATSCVIAGPHEAIDEFELAIQNEGIEAKRLHTSHAFHSAMMDPIVDLFEKAVSKLVLQSPAIPIMSTVTCQWLTAEQATDPTYWATHLRKPVLFFDAVQKLRELSDHILLEVGPGRTLATLVGKGAQPALASLPHAAKGESAYQHIRNTLGTLWCHGLAIDWSLVEERSSKPKRIPAPTYPFQRKRFWVEPVVAEHSPQQTKSSQSFTPNPFPPFTSTPVSHPMPAHVPTSITVTSKLKEILSELSGVPTEELDETTSFLELGFDSLLLTQVGKEIMDIFKVKVSLRQLIADFTSIQSLSPYLESNSTVSFSQPKVETITKPFEVQPQPLIGPISFGTPNFQMPQIPGMQLAYIPVMIPCQVTGGFMPMPTPFPMAQQPAKVAAPIPEKPATVSGPTTVIDRGDNRSELTKSQQYHIEKLVERYTEKTKTSKDLTRKYRKFHADPRTASGFNRSWKEMVYQIVTVKSKGSRLIDVDGNEYIDILNGFGPGFLGHSPDFLVEAIENQLHRGYEVGPQSLLAMEAAELFCEVTGNERTSFVCTGSEAVQASIRLARTVTKRDKIVIFARDYHGNFDEVLVRGVNSTTNLKSLPSAPGIPKESVGNMIVLPYGTDESLEIIRKLADQLAAVIVEPVQSRRPEFRPRNFIREVRSITEQSGTLFVFDEVVTGFRFGPRGAQEFYGVTADLCTYGKVIGGGMPLGVVSGKAKYMDTFDGGQWEYGDDSFPEQPVTFFAGTFVRHPLAMASVKAMLEFFKSQPSHFWNQVNAKGDQLAGTIDSFFKANHIPIEMPNCGSLMFVRMGEDQKYGNLFFYHLREKGIFILEGFPSYLTAAHSENDIEYIINAFKESALEMQSGGFFTPNNEVKPFDGATLFGPPAELNHEDTFDRQFSCAPISPKKAAQLTVPTTEPQREILVASTLDDRASCAFNESASLKLKGALNFTALEKAFATVIARHDSLRSTFSNDGLTMIVHPEMPIEIEKIDLTARNQDHLDAILHVDASTPYDLENGPLVRAILVQTAENEYNFVISAHHTVCDGWSYNVIAEELCELYNSNCLGNPHNLAYPRQFAEYSRSLLRRIGSPEAANHEAFWLNEFSSIPSTIELPLDRPYRHDRSFQGATLQYQINREIYEAVKKAGAKYGSTLYSTLSAAFQLLIHRLSGQDDIVICIPTAGQNNESDAQSLVGHCVNFLPLRSRYQSSDSFDQFLAQSRKTLLAATENGSFTYGQLIQKLDIERDPRRLPLLEVAFNVERMDYFGQWKDLDVVFEPNGKSHVHYSMFMNIVESKRGLQIDVDYNTDILDKETIHGWVRCFETLLGEISRNPTAKVSKLSLIDQKQQDLVLKVWNQTGQCGTFPDKTVQELFEETARIYADSTALVTENQIITYSELDRQADSVAHHLQMNGVSPGDFVAIMAEREPAIVAGLLGILKAGAAYLPIDPAYPSDRVEHMLQDSKTSFLLLGSGIKPPAEADLKALVLHDLVAGSAPVDYKSHSGKSTDLAYTIYTSGSTGLPKGTLIPHRGIVRLVRNTNYMEFGPDETFLLSAPISFDASTLELWGPLLNGGKLAMLSPGTPGLSEIGEAVRRHKVTTLWLTSGLFSLMVDEHPEALKGLRHLLAGGDVLSKEHVARALKYLGEKGRMINGYGPTENTTFTTCHHITKKDVEMPSIPIGRPIAHTQCYILDCEMQPTPVGVKGRLYIGGDGLATGYLNQPELTRQRFVPSPFPDLSGDRLYDSGDECRWLRDGTIEFLGRADRQVKIRGFRIEPGEIENILLKHPDINTATVRCIGDDSTDKKLVAYLTGNGLKLGEIESFTRQYLPGYMIPSDFIFLASLPVTTNGKIDYKALPLPATGNQPNIPRRSEPPKTETQKQMVELWSEILDRRDISINDDFFKLGGHSLAGLKLFSRIQNQFDVKLPLATLFKSPTINQLASIIDRNRVKRNIQLIAKVSQGEPNDTPLFLIHGGNGGTLFYKQFIAGQQAYREIYTVEAPMVVDNSIKSTQPSVEMAAAEYIDQILAVSHGKPLAIGGYSFGGVLAYEIALQLASQRIKVENLFLFDTNNPCNEEKFKRPVSTWIKEGWNLIEADTLFSKVTRAGERFGTKVIERSKHKKMIATINQMEKSNQKLDDLHRLELINGLHLKIMLQYEPKPYHGLTHLFKAQSSRYAFDQEMGWRDLIPNLIVTNIKGRHKEIFDTPNVEILIEKFNELFSLHA